MIVSTLPGRWRPGRCDRQKNHLNLYMEADYAHIPVRSSSPAPGKAVADCALARQCLG
ncbi:hypothetical protein CHELA40_30200 [Chelatococcus asaccharovorans]|nr:hypothetical protein CHELA17_40214 [Chelatococcus asaccharovorans]CAH1688314.1 hypothetical protein CHELA40_30200 [Chelatococcus asaccharovorans]